MSNSYGMDLPGNINTQHVRNIQSSQCGSNKEVVLSWIYVVLFYMFSSCSIHIRFDLRVILSIQTSVCNMCGNNL